MVNYLYNWRCILVGIECHHHWHNCCNQSTIEDTSVLIQARYTDARMPVAAFQACARWSASSPTSVPLRRRLAASRNQRWTLPSSSTGTAPPSTWRSARSSVPNWRGSCPSICTSFSIRQRTARSRNISRWRTRTTNDTLAEGRRRLARIRGTIRHRCTRLSPSTATCPSRRRWGTTRTTYFSATPRDIPYPRPPLPSPSTPRFTWPATDPFTRYVEPRRGPVVVGTLIRFGGRLSYEGGWYNIPLVCDPYVSADNFFRVVIEIGNRPTIRRSTRQFSPQSIDWSSGSKASGKSMKRWWTLFRYYARLVEGLHEVDNSHALSMEGECPILWREMLSMTTF